MAKATQVRLVLVISREWGDLILDFKLTGGVVRYVGIFLAKNGTKSILIF